MATINDTLITSFVTQGQTELIDALNKIRSAYNRLNNAQKRAQASATQTASTLKTAASSLASAGSNVSGGTASNPFGNVALSLIGINSALGLVRKGWQAIRWGIDEATDALKQYSDYTLNLLNIKELTGASLQQAGAEQSLFKVAGVNDQQGIRLIMNSVRDLTTKQGLSTLGRIGVVPRSGENGVELLNDIISHLKDIKDGTKRTALEIQAFRVGGAKFLQPLFRMSNEQSKRAIDAMPQISAADVQSVVDMNIELNLMSETWQSKIITPFGQAMAPAAEIFYQSMQKLITATAEALNNANAWDILADSLVIVSSFVSGLADIIKYLEAPITQLNHLYQLLQIATGSNPIDILGGKKADKADKLTDALDDNTDATLQLSDHISRLSANKGIPGALSNSDLNMNAAMGTLGGIG